MRASLALLGILGLACCLSRPSMAAQAGDAHTAAVPAATDAPAQVQRWALVVGISRYADASLLPLPFCARDAHDVAGVLGAAGYEVVQLSDEMADDRLRPTRSNILAQTHRFLTDPRIQADDVLLTYFSGHGFATDAGAYLAAADTYQDLAEQTALRVSWLRDMLAACPARRKVLILDACHAGLGKGGAAGEAAERINSAAQGAGMITLASCRGDEKSWEFRDPATGAPATNSAFTHFLLSGLGGEADRDRDGEVCLTELNRYLYERVVGWAQGVGLQQTPVMAPASLEGDIPIIGRRNQPAEGPAVALRPAVLVVVTDPPGAEISVDGAAAGQAPCEVQLDAGAEPRLHRVELRKAGFKPLGLRVYAAAGDRADPGVVRLLPEPVLQVTASQAAGAEAATGQVWVNPKDGEEMVLVPAGEYPLGTDAGSAVERPSHRATLSAYYIGKTEVTVAQFRCFVVATRYEAQGDWQTTATDDRLPVSRVTWKDATAYCAWAGGRLPSEAEWEVAARGTQDGRYPWGANWASDLCNGRGGGDGFSGLAPVGAYPKGASPVGCLDMLGNAWEWTSSLHRPYPYDAGDGREDPRAAGERVLRGGGWSSMPGELSVTARRGASTRTRANDVGFRCVVSAQ